MNPLWVDARDYLTSQGQPVTTRGLSEAMNLLASNPQLRPSAVKAGGGAAGIAAGLGAPTDQIVPAPLAPPVATGGSPSPSPRAEHTGRSKQGASSGNRTAGGTSASGKTVKDVPGGVGNYAATGGQNNANAQGITPPSGYTPTTAPSSPVGSAQAGTSADDPGFLAHLMSGDYNGRVAALGGAGAAALGAWLMGRDGSEGGSRPINSREGEVIPPDRMTVYGQGSAGGPIINGDPIQQLLGQSETPAPQGATGALQVATPQSFEDMIAQLAGQAPNSGALPPPAARPPIQMPNQTSGPPIPMGNSTSGPTINIPPTGGQQLLDILRHLGGVDSSTMGGAR